MTRFFVSRALRAVLVIIALICVTFLLTRSFADPARLMLPLDAPESDYLALREEMGLDEPTWKQLFLFLGDAVRGDFGTSSWQGTDAFGLVVQRIPATMLLGGAAIGLALVIGIPLGVAGGRRPGSLIDRIGMSISSIAVSVPDFWFGILLILLFSVQLALLPTSGYGGWRYLILPAVSLALRPLGRSARIAREAVVDEMSKRYVTTARAKGLSVGQSVWRHVLPNVVPLAFTVLAYDFVFIFTGYAAYVETVFEWPGVGKLVVDAVLHHDVNLVGASVFLAGILVAVVNTVIDVAHAAIDRRISLG